MFDNVDWAELEGVSDDELLALLDGIEDKQEFARVVLLPAVANEFSPRGYGAAFELFYGMRITEHGEKWVQDIFDDYEQGKGTVIQAFRGSSKTTTLTIGFAAFFIGHHPELSNLLIQVGDGIAQDNTEAIADLIANNDGYKAVFPSVEPDYDKGWGAAGYEVKRTDIPYERWRQQNAQRKDPSFVGLGYQSRSIIGKRPTGLLLVDDIHDENNTRSHRELTKVIKIVTGTIFPTMTPQTWRVFVGTPWVEKDTLGYVGATGEFNTHRTPVYTDGKPTWPERFSEEEIQKQKNLNGQLEFARMFLLDLEATKGINLKAEWLHEYPADQIGASWPVYMGIDYASTADKLKNKDRDYFAMAIGKAIPGGGLVIIDGYRGHVSKAEAMKTTASYAAMYPMLQLIGVENIGKGEEFYNDLLLTIDVAGKPLPLMAIAHGRKSKGERFEGWLAPRFQASRIWISDTPSPYLREFRNEWVSWQSGGEHDDCIDGVYMCAVAAEGVLPSFNERTYTAHRHTKSVNPYAVRKWA